MTVKVSIEDIQKRVAQHYNMRLADMSLGKARPGGGAAPADRDVSLKATDERARLPDIGRKFGGRDHTTVMHAVKKIEELKATDAGFADDIDLLKRMLDA